MTDNFRVVDYDIIYLSYDEPNAERNYADLCQKVPWAKRVHGVKGSDAAHKACAEISETDRFITVDGDNVIDPNFLQQEIDLNGNEDLSNCVISWAANNQINGLIYGNGGIKCWPKDYVLNMRTHEAADPKNKHAQVDFCWDTKYIQIEGCFSKIYNNATPQQAWRAGFREGVKMCLNRGIRPLNAEEFFENHWKNLHRLYIWMTVGADADNGLWAIYGARQGFYKTMFTDWDFVNVRDFDYLNNYWSQTLETISEDFLLDEIENLAKEIKDCIDIPISVSPLEPEASRFYKYTYQSPARLKTGFLKDIQ
jgi:hypothetical protein